MAEDVKVGGSGAVRPRNLIFAVNERPPARQLLLLGVQYAILDAIYLVLVAIILRHAHVLGVQVEEQTNVYRILRPY